VADIDDVRSFALRLPRTTEAVVRDRVKFRVGRIVYLALSRDEAVMGFGFPKEEREALVASDPQKFLMPEPSDLRYRWVQVRLDAIDVTEMRELVLDAWRMCVPKRVAADYETTSRPSPMIAEMCHSHCVSGATAASERPHRSSRSHQKRRLPNSTRSCGCSQLRRGTAACQRRESCLMSAGEATDPPGLA
jgi:hypothetical protein